MNSPLSPQFVPHSQGQHSPSSSTISSSSSPQPPHNIWPMAAVYLGELGGQQTASRNSSHICSSSESSTGAWSSDQERECGEEGEEEGNGQLQMIPTKIGNSSKFLWKKEHPREERRQRPNQCAVCGRPANCYHFDVPSCLGCRSFFRRSILSQRQYQCQNRKECKLDQGEICRSCRFDGCILAGMNPRSIRAQTNQGQIDAAIAFLERRKMELLGQIAASATSATLSVENEEEIADNCNLVPMATSTGEIMFDPSFEGTLESELFASLLYADDKILRIRYSETPVSADFYAKKDLLDILEESQSLLARADKFSNHRIVPKSVEYHIAQIEQGNIGCANPNWLFIDCYLCFELAKTLPIFRELCIEDQITLIANNALTAVVFSQSFYSMYVSGTELLTFPNGFTPMCFHRNEGIVPIKNKLFNKNMQPFRRVAPTREEFLVLRTILLLQTASANLTKSGCILLQNELEKYSKALMKYERWRFGDLCGTQRFAELMFFNNSVREIGHEHQTFLAYVTTVLDACRIMGHPDYMDNVIFGIAGKKVQKKIQIQPWAKPDILENKVLEYVLERF